jgi:dTDP-4-amino-4,6-dideoxygalactose transaminase
VWTGGVAFPIQTTSCRKSRLGQKQYYRSINSWLPCEIDRILEIGRAHSLQGSKIVTNDGELATRLRRLRHQGMSLSDFQRHNLDPTEFETNAEVGYGVNATRLRPKRTTFFLSVDAGNGLPVSERLAREVLSLPMHAYLDEAAQQRICDAVCAAVA